MKPVVFLPGFLGVAAEWVPVQERMTSEVTSRAMALPTASDWESGIREILTQLPAVSFLVGYSMGARLALGCALAAPTRFTGLGFISGNPGLRQEERATRWQQDETWAKQIEGVPWQRFLSDWYNQPVFDSVSADERAAWIRQRTELNRSEQAHRLRCFSIAKQPDYWAQLAGLQVPTLVLVGEKDAKYREIARQMTAHQPKLTVQIVDGAGHAVHRERPREVAKALTRFMTKHDLQETNHE